MVRPDELVNSIIRSLDRSGRLPDTTSYMDHEPDINTESIKLPVVEVSPNDQLRIDEMNTDRVGYETDDDGNRVGEIFQSLYQQEITVAIWTAQDSKYNVRKLAQQARDTLYEHDTKGPAVALRYGDNSPIGEVWRFRILDGAHVNDLTTSPPLRRWEQTVSVWASEQYTVSSGKPVIRAYDVLEPDTST